MSQQNPIDAMRPPIPVLINPSSAAARPATVHRPLNEIWRVIEAIGEWSNLVIATNGDALCLALNGVVLGRLRWNGRIILQLTPELRAHLLAQGIVTTDENPAHVTFDVETAADAERAVWLLRLAYLTADSKTIATCA